MNCRYLAIFALASCWLFSISAQTSINLTDPIQRFRLDPVEDGQEFVVGPVVPGQSYVLTLLGGQQGAYAIDALTGADDQGEQHFFNRQFTATGHQFKFIVSSRPNAVVGDLLFSIADLERLQGSNTGRSSNAESLARMMGIEAIRNSDSEELVNSIFKNQSCFQTSNHAYNGVSGFWPPLNDTVSQLGTFSNGSSSIELDEGMVIITGLVSEVEGPNDFFASGQGFNVIATDPDIIQLAGNNTPYDLVTIEFDFIPTTNFINFNYVFASEEYCSQIGFGTSDVFGFLISGPGINGTYSNDAINIATLPAGATLPGGRPEITSSAISPFVNSGLFNSNTLPNGPDNCSTQPPAAFSEIEFDGFSDVLTASATVIPCEVYHLKLLLADAGDAFTNSAVFFQRGSFAGGLVGVSEPTGTAQTGDLANAPLEGCSNGELTFTRIDSLLDQPVTVYFNISTESTATFGVDYTMPVDSIVIPAGQLSETLIIDIFPDNLSEGTENIIIQVTGTCNCEDFVSEFFIVDPPVLTLQLDSPLADCAGTDVDLIPIVTNGVGQYSFTWSSGSVDSIENVVRLPGDSLYILSVTDECQQVRVDTAIVSAPDIQATISGVASLCDAPTAQIPVALSGGGTYSIVVSENGNNVTYTSSSDTLWLDYTAAVALQLVSVTSGGCSGVVSGSAAVTDGSFSVTAVVQNVNCFGSATGSLSLDVNGNPSVYTYEWATPTLSGSSLSNLIAGTYPVRILDPAGCFFDTSFVISQPDQALLISLDSIRNQDCLVDGYLEVSVSGGTSPYQLAWQDNASESLVRDNLVGGVDYTLVVIDGAGCQASETYRPLDAQTNIIANIFAAENELTCSTTEITLNAGGNNPSSVVYSWFGPNDELVGSSAQLTVSTTGLYRVSILNPGNGCTAQDNITITRTADTLALVFLDEYLLNCTVNSLDLEVEATNFNGPATYTWFDENMVQIGNGINLSGITTAGSYTVRGVRDDNNCETFASTMVSIDREEPQATVGFPTLLSCSSDTATLEVQALNVIDPVYSWSTLDGNIAGNTTNSTIEATLAGTYSLRITNLDNGCFADFATELNDDQRTLAPNAGLDQLLNCTDVPTVLTATTSPNLVGTQFRWLDASGEVLSLSPELLPLVSGVYTLEVIHPESGCISTDEVQISSQGPTAAELSIQQPPCEEIGATITVTNVRGGRAPYTYFTDNQPALVSTTGILTGVPSGFHFLSVEDANGCRYEEEIQVVEPAVFTGIAEDVEIRLGEVATLGVRTNRDSQVNQLLWDAPVELNCVDCPNPTANPVGSFTANVLITDEDGCELRLRQNVFVDENNIVYIPNAFSPGIPDGINDLFTVYGDTRFITNVRFLRVYDRWGNAVYAEENFPPNDESSGWNGMNNGQNSPSGTYIFVTEVDLWDGRKEVFRGSINLVR